MCVRVVGVRPELEMCKKLIVAGFSDPALIANETGIDQKTVEAFVKQWKIWRANDAQVSTLSVEH